MIRTISLGRYISVQGLLEAITPEGLVTVRVGEKLFTGRPV